MPSKPPELNSHLSTSIDDGVIDLDDDGATDVSPNELPGLNSRLSTSIHNDVIYLEGDSAIDVIPS